MKMQNHSQTLIIQSPFLIQQLTPNSNYHIDGQWSVRSFNVRVAMDRIVRVNVMEVEDQGCQEGIQRVFEGEKESLVGYCGDGNRSRVRVKKLEVGSEGQRGMREMGKSENTAKLKEGDTYNKEAITYLAIHKLLSNQSIAFSFDHQLFSGMDALIVNHRYLVYGQKCTLPLEIFLSQTIPKGYTIQMFRNEMKRLIEDVHFCGILVGIAKRISFSDKNEFVVEMGQGLKGEIFKRQKGNESKDMLGQQSEDQLSRKEPEWEFWSMASFAYDISARKIILDLSSSPTIPFPLNQLPYSFPIHPFNSSQNLSSINLYESQIALCKKFITSTQQKYFNSPKPKAQFFECSFSEPRMNSGFQAMVLKNESVLAQLRQRQHRYCETQHRRSSEMPQKLTSLIVRGKLMGMALSSGSYVEFVNGFQRVRKIPFNPVLGLIDENKLTQRHPQRQTKPNAQKLQQPKPPASFLHKQTKLLTKLLTNKYQLQLNHTSLSQLLIHQKQLLINRYHHSCDIDVVLEIIQFKLASVARPCHKEELIDECHSYEMSPNKLGNSKRTGSLESREGEWKSKDLGEKIKMKGNLEDCSAKRSCSYLYENVNVWEEIALARNYANLLSGNTHSNAIKSKPTKRPAQNFNLQDFKHQILHTLKHIKQQIQKVQQSLCSKTFQLYSGKVQTTKSQQVSQDFILSTIDHNLIMLELSYRYHFYLSIYYRLPGIYNLKKAFECLEKCKRILQKALTSINELVKGNKSLKNNFSSGESSHFYQLTIENVIQMSKTMQQGRIVAMFQILAIMIDHQGRCDYEVERMHRQLKKYVGQYYGEYHEFNIFLLLIQFKFLHLKDISVHSCAKQETNVDCLKQSVILPSKEWMLEIFIKIKRIQIINGEHRMSNWVKQFPFVERKLLNLQRQIKRLTQGKEQMKLLIQSSLQSYRQVSKHYSKGLWRYTSDRANYNAKKQSHLESQNESQTLESVFNIRHNCPHVKPPQAPSLYQRKIYPELKQILCSTGIKIFKNQKYATFSMIEAKLSKVYDILKDGWLWARVEEIMGNKLQGKVVSVLQGELWVYYLMVVTVQLGKKTKCTCIVESQKLQQLSTALKNHLQSLSHLSEYIVSKNLSSQFTISVKFLQTITKISILSLQSISQLRQSSKKEFLKSLLKDIEFFKRQLEVQTDYRALRSPQFRRVLDENQLFVILLLNDRPRLISYYNQKLLFHTIMSFTTEYHNYSSIIQTKSQLPTNTNPSVSFLIHLPSTLRHSSLHLIILAQLQLQHGNYLLAFQYIQESFKILVQKLNDQQKNQQDDCLMVQCLEIMIKVMLKWWGVYDAIQETYQMSFARQRMQSILKLLSLTSVQSQFYHINLISFIFFITQWLQKNLLKTKSVTDKIILALIKEPFSVRTQLIDLMIMVFVDVTGNNSRQDYTVLFLIYQIIFLEQNKYGLSSSPFKFISYNRLKISQDQKSMLPFEVASFVLTVFKKIFDELQRKEELHEIMWLLAMKWLQSQLNSQEQLQNLTKLCQKAFFLSKNKLNITSKTQAYQLLSSLSTISFSTQSMVQIYLLCYLQEALSNCPNESAQNIVESMIDLLIKQQIKLTWMTPLIEWGYGINLLNKLRENNLKQLKLEDIDFLTRIFRFINSKGLQSQIRAYSQNGHIYTDNFTQKLIQSKQRVHLTRQLLFEAIEKFLTNRHLKILKQAFIKQALILTNLILENLLYKKQPKNQNLSQIDRQILSNLCLMMLKLINNVVARQMFLSVSQDVSVIKNQIALLMYLVYTQEVSILVGKKEGLMGKEQNRRMLGKMDELWAQLALGKIKQHKTIGKMISISGTSHIENGRTNSQNIHKLSALIISHLSPFTFSSSQFIEHIKPQPQQSSSPDISLQHYLTKYFNHLAHFIQLTDLSIRKGKQLIVKVKISVRRDEQSLMRIEVKEIGCGQSQRWEGWEQSGLEIDDVDVIKEEKEKLEHYLNLIQERYLNYIMGFCKTSILAKPNNLADLSLQEKTISSQTSFSSNFIFLKLIQQLHCIFTSTF